MIITDAGVHVRKAETPERMAVTADPSFVHDTAQSGLELDAMPGEDLDRISARILQTPTDVVALARAVGK
jgi:hypothetical protein